MTPYRGPSLWHDGLDKPLTPRPRLDGDAEVDVAIVGAGYTGLWTAYYLAKADPRLRVAVCEREVAGFGASGRNGGWCSALFPVSLRRLARLAGARPAVALHRELHRTVDEVGRVVRAERIACGWTKGGTVALARSPAQLSRAAAEVAEARAFGFGEDDLALLDTAEARAHCAASGVLGGTYTPHCAAVHPARLVRGLARVVERRGVLVYERTPVLRLARGRVVTPYGTVRARTVLRATEGYTSGLPGHRRLLVPVYSLMLATSPLSDAFWGEVGLSRRETFTDFRRLVVYGQRTADNRLAFGGRGAPYHYGSRTRPGYDHDRAVFTALERALRELFPVLSDVDHDVTHTWGGPLGIPRDWCPSVTFDPATGYGAAGGYVGDGVAASNLAGRTLADLVLGRDTELTRMPWVNHRSPRWEPEPLRWAGINLARYAVAAADRGEVRTGRAPRWTPLVTRLLGG